MLNVFPDLLAFGLFGPFVLRVVVGALFGVAGLKMLRMKKRSAPGIVVGILKTACAALLIVGLWTQIAALILALIALAAIVARYKSGSKTQESINYQVLLFVAAVSLIFTGAGFFAIDLPL